MQATQKKDREDIGLAQTYAEWFINNEQKQGMRFPPYIKNLNDIIVLLYESPTTYGSFQ